MTNQPGYRSFIIKPALSSLKLQILIACLLLAILQANL